MRVVFDTNILVSFAIRPSPSFERIFDHVAAHGISLVSEETVAELFDVLSRDKFRRYIPLSAAIVCRVVCGDFGTGRGHGERRGVPRSEG
jgi:predicted nucleic acid-binding protein